MAYNTSSVTVRIFTRTRSGLALLSQLRLWLVLLLERRTALGTEFQSHDQTEVGQDIPGRYATISFYA